MLTSRAVVVYNLTITIRAAATTSICPVPYAIVITLINGCEQISFRRGDVIYIGLRCYWCSVTWSVFVALAFHTARLSLILAKALSFGIDRWADE